MNDDTADGGFWFFDCGRKTRLAEECVVIGIPKHERQMGLDHPYRDRGIPVQRQNGLSQCEDLVQDISTDL